MDTSTVSIEAVRNIKTQQVFVLVDDSKVTQIEVINPDGKVLTVPQIIFEEKFRVGLNEIQTTFNEKQIATINSLRSGKKKTRTSAKTGTTRKVTRKKAAKAVNNKVGLGAEWSASRLTFYKHKIDPLGPKQYFIVNVEGKGPFKITKEDFLKVFSDVTFKESYWKEGSFSYEDVPEKSLPFFSGDA